MSPLVAHDLHVAGTRGPRLSAVSCCIRPGELHVLIGPNGAGKSTLLAALAGLLHPDHGNVRLDARCLSRWHPRALACRRAVLPQHNPMAFDYSVEALLALGLHPHDAGTDTALELAVDALELAPLMQQRMHTLSGGEQQRAQLGRVLAQLRPAAGCYLLLDEPLAALDLRFRVRLLALLKRLLHRGVGIVLSIHELDTLHDLDAEVHLLHTGSVLETSRGLNQMGIEALSRAYGGPVQFETRAIPVLQEPHPTGD